MRRITHTGLLLSALGVAHPAFAQETIPDDAFELHARAMEAELDGDPATALELLKKAFSIAPEDKVISNDLVRLLRTDASSKKELGRVLEQLNPTLRARARTQDPKKRPFFSARIVGGAQYDSNVLVVPDQPNPGAAAPQSAARALLDGDLKMRLLQGTTRSSLRAGFSAGPHLTDDVALTAFDAFGARASIDLGHQNGAIEWYGALRSNALFIDRSALNPFLFSTGASAGVRYSSNSMRVGFTVSGDLRAFDEGNPEGEANDRDGTRTTAVANVAMGDSRLAVFGSAGYQGEQTDGDEQTENGAIASVGVRYALDPVVLTAGANYTLRDYSAPELGRVDQRLTGSAGALYQLDPTWGVSLRGSWTENFSDVNPTEAYLENTGIDEDDLDFSYTRQLVTMGVEAKW